MKSIIVYYSYTGNTKKVAEAISEYLKQKGEVEVVELKDLNESDKFFIQAIRALRHKRTKIQESNLNLSNYDLICIGSPVWACGPAPAVNAYLDKCSNVKGKSVVLFISYGGGMGAGRCLNYMEMLLRRKGAKEFKKFSVWGLKVNDKKFIEETIKEKFKDFPG